VQPCERGGPTREPRPPTGSLALLPGASPSYREPRPTGSPQIFFLRFTFEGLSGSLHRKNAGSETWHLNLMLTRHY
jgi:hypothetical protein